MIIIIKIVGNVKQYVKNLDTEIETAVHEHHKSESPTLILPNLNEALEILSKDRMKIINALRCHKNSIPLLMEDGGWERGYVVRELALLDAFGIIKYEDGTPIAPDKIIIEV